MLASTAFLLVAIKTSDKKTHKTSDKEKDDVLIPLIETKKGIKQHAE